MKRLCREDGREPCNTAGEDEVCVTMKGFIICGEIAGKGGWWPRWRVGELAVCFFQVTAGYRSKKGFNTEERRYRRRGRPESSAPASSRSSVLRLFLLVMRNLLTV